MMENNTQPPRELILPAHGGRPVTVSAAASNGHEDDDEIEYTDTVITNLLKEAEGRLKNKAALKKGKGDLAASSKSPFVNLPKLDVGFLPKPYISTAGNVSRASSTSIPTLLDKSLAENPKCIEDPVIVKKRLKEEKEKTTGPDWFDLPRTKLTPEVKRDLQLIKLRGVLDPKRHYKKDKSKGFPKYSQLGTVIEGSTEFYSARLSKRDRKQTLLDEVLSSGEAMSRFKKKYQEVQMSKRSGRKEHFKKLKEQRRSKQ